MENSDISNVPSQVREYEDYLDQRAKEAYEQEKEEEWLKEYKIKRQNYPPWQDKDGVQTKICEMSDEKLNSCLDSLKETPIIKNNKQPEYIEFLKQVRIWIQLLNCEIYYRSIKNIKI